MSFSKSSNTASTCASRAGSLCKLSKAALPVGVPFRFLRIGCFLAVLSIFCPGLAQVPSLNEQIQVFLETEQNTSQVGLTPARKIEKLQQIGLYLRTLARLSEASPEELRAAGLASQEGPELPRSRLVGLENSLLALDDRLRETRTIAASGQVSGRWVLPDAKGKSQSFNRLVGFGGLGLNVLIDQGKQFEWGLDLGTQSPLREESGLLRMPLKEADALAIRSGWLLAKGNNALQLKLGMFPDVESVARPKYWPLLGVQGIAQLYNDFDVNLILRARHDRFGYLSPRSTTTVAQNLERNLSEAVLRATLAGAGLEWRSRASYGLHWYSDPQRQLSSLALGQTRYSNTPSLSPATQYRVSAVTFALDALSDEAKIASLRAEFWANHLSQREGRAHILSAEILPLPSLGIVLERVSLGSQFMPRLGTSEFYQPGEDLWRGGLSTAADLTRQSRLEGSLWAGKTWRLELAWIWNFTPEEPPKSI